MQHEARRRVNGLSCRSGPYHKPSAEYATVTARLRAFHAASRPGPVCSARLSARAYGPVSGRIRICPGSATLNSDRQAAQQASRPPRAPPASHEDIAACLAYARDVLRSESDSGSLRSGIVAQDIGLAAAVRHEADDEIDRQTHATNDGLAGEDCRIE